MLDSCLYLGFSCPTDDVFVHVNPEGMSVRSHCRADVCPRTPGPRRFRRDRMLNLTRSGRGVAWTMTRPQLRLRCTRSWGRILSLEEFLRDATKRRRKGWGMRRMLIQALGAPAVVAAILVWVWVGPVSAPEPAMGADVPTHGYWLVGSDGGVFSFGSAQFFGSAANLDLQSPVVGIAPTPDRDGYWLVASDGGVFSFGDANYYGSIPGLGIAPIDSALRPSLDAPIVGMVPSYDGHGYFLVASDGGVFAFGDARFEGSCPGIGGCPGGSGIADVMAEATGNGYWVVSYTGDVHAFGEATNYGGAAQYLTNGAGYLTNSAGEVLSAVSTPSGHGYWVLVSNGEVYTFGDAAYFGSPLDQLQFSNPASAIFSTSDGDGYWITTFRGAVYSYGDAPYYGGVSSHQLNGQIVAASGS